MALHLPSIQREKEQKPHGHRIQDDGSRPFIIRLSEHPTLNIHGFGQGLQDSKRILWHDIWRDSNRSGSLLSHHDLRTFKEGRDKALGMIQCVMS